MADVDFYDDLHDNGDNHGDLVKFSVIFENDGNNHIGLQRWIFLNGRGGYD